MAFLRCQYKIEIIYILFYSSLPIFFSFFFYLKRVHKNSLLTEQNEDFTPRVIQFCLPLDSERYSLSRGNWTHREPVFCQNSRNDFFSEKSTQCKTKITQNVILKLRTMHFKSIFCARASCKWQVTTHWAN